MKLSRTICILSLFAIGLVAQAQPWATAYEQGLEALRVQNWSAARAAFLESTKSRPVDSAKGTTLAGPVTERKQWRGGSPYSANFAAAYAGLKQSFAVRDETERTALLKQVASEFEELLKKKQNSKETFYFLNIAYSTLSDREGLDQLDAQFTKVRKKLNWKIDAELIGPEDMAAIEDLAKVDASTTRSTAAIDLKTQTNPTNPTAPAKPEKTKPEPRKKEPDPARSEEPVRQNPTNPANPVIPKPEKRVTNPGNEPPTVDPSTLLPDGGTSGTGVAGKVATIPTKFALIIANSQCKIADLAAPDFALNDAALIKDTLTQSTGYAEENIVVLENASAAQMLAAAASLADRVPEDGTVTVYFAGVGVNLDGKDFLAGVGAESATDSANMAAKMDLLRPFISKGARIFAFFEANRPILNGRFFGGEAPFVGTVAQVQATIPGGSIYSVIKGGKPVGVFANAFSSVLTEFKSNRIPILEFAWQVFYRMRRGNTGVEGGGSMQTPTLPILTNIASDAKF
ncbi:MAG: caspase family protein [Fimbriimonadaceae bacterium]|nr:caspase family protein [Fimbriimonadaceae bacterium]